MKKLTALLLIIMIMVSVSACDFWTGTTKQGEVSLNTVNPSEQESTDEDDGALETETLEPDENTEDSEDSEETEEVEEIEDDEASTKTAASTTKPSATAKTETSTAKPSAATATPVVTTKAPAAATATAAATENSTAAETAVPSGYDENLFPQSGFEKGPYETYSGVTFTLSSSATTYKAGDTITFVANIKGLPEFDAMQFVPIYNVELFTPVTDSSNNLKGGFLVDGALISTTEYDGKVTSYNCVAAWSSLRTFEGDCFKFSLIAEEDFSAEEISTVTLFMKAINTKPTVFEGMASVTFN